ncbi:unnamed protein product [Cylindrotheca closterium]|uniref:Mitochondrial fission process protein 1 n=1 Tax=Cylindrotheca closterium TaxID=2856 RepID=A0AAD2CMR2_9STRA|nr:unnamed protein product [Cylindrotheca closterium]
MEESKDSKDKKYDIFRDSPLRYLGYANEIGESFRYQFPKFVAPSYVVAFGYCFADAATSGYDNYQTGIQSGSTTAKVDSLVATADTLIWQSLASVMIPGATINMVVKASGFAVLRSPVTFPVAVAKWIPTVTGLASIPGIITPIDHGVDFFMNNTFRKIQWPGASPVEQSKGDDTP